MNCASTTTVAVVVDSLRAHGRAQFHDESCVLILVYYYCTSSCQCHVYQTNCTRHVGV